MIYVFDDMSPVMQALAATLFTWGMTALGALPVLFSGSFRRAVLNAMLGFAGGVMLAASCWSLIIPAIERAELMGMPALVHVTAGLICGGLIMLAGDRLIRHAGAGKLDRCSRTLMFSITLHNIPEGLCVGVAFGAAAGKSDIAAAWMLALGIGLQNFPEGAAVSLPMLRGGMSRSRAFFMGQLSGFVEVVAGVFGAYAVMHVTWLLPFFMALAAGAMIYAVAGEIFPESRDEHHGGGSAFAAIIGFTAMMALDVLLG